MVVRIQWILVFVVACWVAETHTSTSLGQEYLPDLSGNRNQVLADKIAATLQDSGRLQRYHVTVRAQDGVVHLHGLVANAGQHDEVVRLVRSVPGVLQVRDALVVGKGGDIVPVQMDVPGPGPEIGPMPNRLGDNPLNGDTGGILEPTPVFRAPQGGPDPSYQPPPMPPYAWPTYAPYNNYSRVAYPTLYPYQSWPYIGPFNPFPKVPLGWRAVTLRWQDGFWWYGKEATGHDWWRIRYW